MPTIKTTPKDFFLHLGATIALFVSAVALINLSFSSINYAFPDVLAGYFSASSVILPISVLIILVPALYILEWMAGKDLKISPDKRVILVRRWRIFLTLFLTGATILGDLIALLYSYLNGEITTRFICKILVVLVVAGVIFTYYLLERGDSEDKAKSAKYTLAVLGVILAFASIAGGFYIVGSPTKQRALRFDSQKVNDLTNIQYQITNYWQYKQQLPGSLPDLNDSISGFKAPTDPLTHLSYDYSPKGSSSFELCAVFTLSSKDNVDKNGYGIQTAPVSSIINNGNDSWSHAAGHVCFQRTIDPSRYPPARK